VSPDRDQFSHATLALLTDHFHIEVQPTEEATNRALAVRRLNATKLLASKDGKCPVGRLIKASRLTHWNLRICSDE
jgi:hypothetical protein